MPLSGSLPPAANGAGRGVALGESLELKSQNPRQTQEQDWEWSQREKALENGQGPGLRVTPHCLWPAQDTTVAEQAVPTSRRQDLVSQLRVVFCRGKMHGYLRTDQSLVILLLCWDRPYVVGAARERHFRSLGALPG